MLGDCALLAAIPLNRAALAAALGRSDGTDFAAQVQSVYGQAGEGGDMG